MRQYAKCLPFGLLMFLSVANYLSAKPASWMVGDSDPKDLVIQLATIGPGDELYTWWGHSAIIITDTRLGESRFYNYGLFSFEQENFFANFAMGRLWFMVGAGNTQRQLEAYRGMNRTITIQTLHMPPEKRLQLAQFVEINILPQNREYLYDHYYDNCATRVRDILNTASSGRLFDVSDVPAGTTFRKITRRFSGGHYFMDTLLMFLMGQTIDKPITVWETMFLPTELRKEIGTLEVPDGEGTYKPFVSNEIIWNRAIGRKPIPEKAPSAVPLSLALGGGIGLLILLLSIALRSRPSGSRIYFGVASSITGLLIGLPGVVLALMALFTNHTVTYGNENLFLANPVTFLAFPFGIFVAAGFRRIARMTAWLWLFLSGIALLYILLKPLPFFIQDNWQIIALILPLLGALAFAGRNLLKRA